MPRLYLDNSATSFPKPPGVYEAMLDYATRVGASPGRGFYAESREGARLLRRTRELINRFINGENPDHVIFTLNTSDALNVAIKGIVRQRRLSMSSAPTRPAPSRGLQPAPIHIITTALDHNSVLRPLTALAQDGGVEWSVLQGERGTGRVSAEHVAAAIRPTTALVAIVHASNVAGTLQPIAQIGRVCRDKGVPFLVDAAQSLGHVPVDVQAMSIDLLAFPGHKGLLGPQGTGGLYIRPGVEKLMATWREGGTGHLSEHDIQPDDMPQKFEAGSHNTAGLVGLGAAVQWILDRGVDHLRAHELELIELFLGELRAGGARFTDTAPRHADLDAGPEPCEGPGHGSTSPKSREDPLSALTLLGPSHAADRVAVFSFIHDSLAPGEFAAILESQFGILVRSGLTCAPHAHTLLGTHPDQGGQGAFRLSFGPFVTREDVLRAVEALRAICSTMAPAMAK